MGGFRLESEYCRFQGPMGRCWWEVVTEGVFTGGLQLGQQWVGVEGRDYVSRPRSYWQDSLGG